MFFLVESNENTEQIVSSLRSANAKFSWISSDPCAYLQEIAITKDDGKTDYANKEDINKLVYRSILCDLDCDIDGLSDRYRCQWSASVDGRKVILTPITMPSKKHVPFRLINKEHYRITIDPCYRLIIDLLDDEYGIKETLISKNR